jgi:hypothetical protein
VLVASALVVPAAIVLARSSSATPAASGAPSAAVVEVSRAKRRAVTDAQRETTIERVSQVRRIVSRMEPQARAKGLSPDWRRALLEALLPLGDEALREVEARRPSLDTMAETIAGVKDDPRFIGDPNKDLMFTPITPCRVIDTRNVAGKVAGVRAYDADTNGATYGGSAACNLQSAFGVTNASQIGALAMNVTIVDTSSAGAPGFLAVKPSAASPTTSLLNWYQAGSAVQIANQGVVTLDQASGTEFVIETSGAVHVIVDIFGAFVEPQATAIGTIRLSASESTPSGNAEVTISPPCPFTHFVLGGGCETGVRDHFINASYPYHHPSSAPYGAWWCSTKNNSTSGSSSTAFVICGTVPGR